ncbi:MAG: SDR family oxidoreductase [Flavobacteriales bacterium]|nr:SDR family oxidoreductase [Flavobacteriales bacterium]
MNLKGKIALVTGGSSGIGKETARQLVKAGAIVYVTGRNKENLDSTAKEIGAISIVSDVSKQEDVDRVFEKIMDDHGRLDVLVNNAGLAKGWTEIDEISMEDMRFVYGINVFGAAMMGQGAAKIFKQQRSGNIINIGSTASLKGFANGSIYASSKFALRGLSQCWQAELRPYNVRVMHINPSEVTTAFGTADGKSRSEVDNKLRSEEIAHLILSQLKMDDRGFVPEVTIWATNPW